MVTGQCFLILVSASSMKASAALCIISGRRGLYDAALTKHLQPHRSDLLDDNGCLHQIPPVEFCELSEMNDLSQLRSVAMLSEVTLTPTSQFN